jgi:transcriptional regulator with XRE-family HTH domain
LGGFPVSEPKDKRQDLTRLGLAIGELRRREGLSRSELARTAGVEEARLSALETGRLDPDYELLLTLAEGIGVPPSAFVLRAEEIAGEQPRSRPEV